MPIASIDPVTGNTLRTFEEHDGAAVEQRLARAHEAARAWRRAPITDRVRVLARAAEILEGEKDAFARLMTQEMGKPIGAAREEAAKCAAACRFYADHAAAFTTPETVVDERGHRGWIAYEPIGVVLAVMPWNFPFWQVVRFAAPAIAAGNVGLLKHASNVPQCALALEDLFRRAGAPEGVFQTLLVGSAAVEGILADPRVAAATLTGSTPAGASVASTAGRHIKKTVLELGGSDPFVVLPSADVAKAADTAVKARTINSGQSCIAAKRFIVHADVYDEFTGRFVDGMKRLVVGDPMDEKTQVGPLATAGIAEEVDAQVRRSVEAGAKVLCGGKRVNGQGNFYEPTVLADVPRESPAWKDEIFGPVATLARASSADEALALANDTQFGLGASVWTRDQSEGVRFAHGLESGTVFVNAMVASDPRFPFGGVKASGYGRELAAHGLREFVNVKSVRVMMDATPGTATE
jgi:succinate-semialdehyde dehydrogenase / glutarate-semialdehyde dehydrogenase